MKGGFMVEFWGVNDEISIPVIVVRALAMFLLTFLIIRLTGMRSFRRNSPFDMVIAFLVGGVLSRGVVGATPFLSALAGGISLILLQKIFYKVSLRSDRIENLIKGERLLIYKDGKFIKENMHKADITSLEIYEDLRVELQTESLSEIAEIYVEKTGEISFVRK